MTKKAKGYSQAWDASGRGGLEEPSRLEASSLQKGGGRTHQAQAGKRKQAQVAKRLEDSGNMGHTACNREWWAIQLNRS